MRKSAVLLCLLLIVSAVPAASPPGPQGAEIGSPPRRPPPLADRDGNRLSDGLQTALERTRPGDPLRVIVTFRGPASVAAAQQAVGLFQVHREFSLIHGFAATMTAAQVRALAAQPGVLRIEEDATVTTQLDAARADFGADAAQAVFSLTGNGIKACIVDTGVDPQHEQLNDRPIPFYDAVNGRTAPYDDHGHGTHVASIAFGDGTGGPGAARYRGVAPGVAVHAAKVLDAAGSGPESGVIAGIEWCVQQGVHLISMSLGTPSASDGKDALSQAVDAASARNVTVVVAAGNSGDSPGTVGSPGAAAQAITVGACAERSAPIGAPNHSQGIYLAPFSSRGPTLDNRTKPDLCAPGHTITAAQAGTAGNYVTFSGTSMATPFVAGTVALGLQARPMAPAEVRQLLEATAQDRGLPGKDNDFGAGLLDARAFVARAKGASGDPPTAFPTHRRVTGSVATHGLWGQAFTLGTSDLGIPIAATLTIEGQAKCTLPLLGLCFAAQWDPDLEARLIHPVGGLLSTSTCLANDECGGIGRQETLHAMPTLAGTYMVQVYPAEDSGNLGQGGSFALDLSSGPLGGTATGPALAHVGALQPTATGSKSGWQASVTITLHAADHSPLPAPALVTGRWSGGFTGTSSCTAASGTCTVTSGKMAKGKASVTFTVTGLSGDGLAYDASRNDATSVLIDKP